MATIMRLSLILLVITLLCFVSSLNAEDYVSKDIPPDELVMKTAQSLFQGEMANAKILKIFGKKQSGDDSYKYYFTVSWGTVTNLRSVSIEELDTNIWILNRIKPIQK